MTRRFRENGCGLVVQYVVLKVYVKKYGVWLSLARAPGLGPGGRRFESCHPDLILYFYARGAQWWSTTLPRWGPRVRIPSRAFFIFSGSLYFQRFPLFFIFSPAPPSKAKLLLRSFQIPGNPALQKEFPARKMR